jgi:hypothetical protein
MVRSIWRWAEMLVTSANSPLGSRCICIDVYNILLAAVKPILK